MKLAGSSLESDLCAVRRYGEGGNDVTEEVLLSVKGLKRYFDVGRGEKLKAVDGINFDIKKGETFGLVGESDAENRQQAEPF